MSTAPPRETVSHYRLQELLGRGAMGEVWLADDTQLPRQVAVKLLPVHLAADQSAVERLQREAHAAASVDHPAVVSVYEAGIEAGQPFIVMQRVEGDTLETRLDKGPMPIPEAVELGMTIADALAEVHALGIVHRDLKPANIVMATRGPRILDFGVASVKGSARMTETGLAVGTPLSMSPEQVKGLPPDNRSDLWALGVILYQALTGKPPFAGASIESITYQVTSEQPPDPSSLRREISRDLEYIVMKLLRKDADGRYGRAEDVIADLRSCMPTIERESKHPASEPTIPRIGVMYFDVMSADPDDAFLASGLTDDLIVDLTQVEGVHVASRADVQPYRDRTVPPRTLAREINVGYVVTGSVRRAGNRARISAQLVRATDGHTMWAERFDRTLEDLFDVQAEVSKRIVEALQVALKPGEEERLESRPTESTEAYSLYLQGRGLVDGDRADNLKAEALLKRAIELDPEFALAHAALGETYAWRGMRWWAGLEDVAVAALRHAEKALEKDPNLLEALTVKLMVHRLRGEKDKLLPGLDEIMRRDPDHPQALEWAGWSYLTIGEIEKATETFERLTRLRPELHMAHSWLAECLKRMGRTEESQAAQKRALEAALAQVERNPGNSFVRAFLAIDLIREGRIEEGLTQARLAKELAPDDGRTLYNVACAYARANRPDDAMEVLRRATAGAPGFINDWPKQDPDLVSLHDNAEFRRMFLESEDSG